MVYSHLCLPFICFRRSARSIYSQFLSFSQFLNHTPSCQVFEICQKIRMFESRFDITDLETGVIHARPIKLRQKKYSIYFRKRG